MIESTLARAAHAMHGTLSGADAHFRGVSTDTRSISPGELFVALQGPNFDGSMFVEQAAAANAAGAVANRNIDIDLPLITVGDTRIALGELARDWRRAMPAKVIGITGSNGKTTLKEMIASCLAVSSSTLATEGNLNNDIGVPLMLLKLHAGHEYAVIEMGANNPGEIAYLGRLANSNVVVITNAAPAHLEGFGTIEGVAQAKGEILETDPRPEFAVLNADDPYFEYWNEKAADLNVISFGIDHHADVRAVSVLTRENRSTFTLCSPAGEARIVLQLAGVHNVLNACAAAAVSHALDLPIDQIMQGLECVRPVPGRLRQFVRSDGVTVYDDSYNANPESVIAAAEFLAGQEGTSVLVLGDMAELGELAAELHRSVGRAVKEAGVDILIASGELSRHAVAAFGEGGQWFDSVESAADALRQSLQSDWNVLVKGSRSMRMERVVAALDVATGQVN